MFNNHLRISYTSQLTYIVRENPDVFFDFVRDRSFTKGKKIMGPRFDVCGNPVFTKGDVLVLIVLEWSEYQIDADTTESG